MSTCKVMHFMTCIFGLHCVLVAAKPEGSARGAEPSATQGLADRCSQAPFRIQDAQAAGAGGGCALGVLLVAAGTPVFVRTQVLPMVEHLRHTIGLPDAAGRAGNQPQWALSTEPHLCQGVLEGVLPFFDRVTVGTSQLAHHHGAHNPSLDADLKGSKTAVNLTAAKEREHKALRHWVKAVKVLSSRLVSFQGDDIPRHGHQAVQTEFCRAASACTGER